MPVPLIKQASRLLRKRKFAQVISLLEPKIFHYRNSFQYYFMLGLSCLANGDLSGATSYLNRAAQLNATDVDCRLALAALQFMKSNIDETLKTWLDIIETDRKNKTAHAGLALLRKGTQPADVYEDPKKRVTLLPLPRKNLPILPAAVVLLVLGLAAAGAILLPRVLKPSVQTRVEAQGLDVIIDEGPLRSDVGESRYQLSSKEIESALENAKKLFNRYRDNLALVEINRLLHSNASENVKNVARLLKDHVQTPDFGDFRDNFSLAEVQRDPVLFDGCTVWWKGKIANLRVTSEKMEFTFLVGYHDEEELEGTVPVTLGFAAKIGSGDNLDLLARIAPSSDGIALTGISVHKLP